MHTKKNKQTILLVYMRPIQEEKDFHGGDRFLSVIILVIDAAIWENKYLKAKISKKFHISNTPFNFMTYFHIFILSSNPNIY